MRVPTWLPLLLGVLTAVGPLGTDMYLPAFPAIESSLGSGEGSAQITLAAWFLGLAVGQITQGTLADRFGRRGPLVAGCLLYVVASIGCALATSLPALSAWRVLAAFGGSAGMVIPRAIVRDLTEGHAAARLMSKLLLVMGAAPILAPTLGGLVLSFGSWHWIFWMSAIYGAVCAVLVWWKLPDTLAPERRISLAVGSLARRYASVLRDRIFLSYAMLGSFGLFGMFAYIGGSPPVLIERFALTPVQYGMVFGCSAASFILGSQISPRLLPRYGSARILRVGVRVFLTMACLILVAGIVNTTWLPAIVVPAAVAMGSMGFVMPNAAIGALSRHAMQAGSASAIMGTLQFGLAALSGTLVGSLTDNTARPIGALMVVGGLGAVLVDWLRPNPVAVQGRAKTEAAEREAVE